MRTGPLLPIIFVTAEVVCALVYGWLGYDCELVRWLVIASLTTFMCW